MARVSKRQSERLSRRKETLLKKSYEMAALCDVDVAFFIRIRKTGRLFAYKSLDLESWPPSREQMVSADELVQKHYVNATAANYVPASSEPASSRR